MNAPLPPDESQRLQALRRYAILDTAPEAAFERLTRLAARLFKVPIAAIDLLDAERQWFKSCHGLPFSETPRDVAFCAHAILNDQVLVVPDATQDARFANNPLVRGEAGIRFYAGAPLRTPEGFKVGVLAIMDRVPRELSEDEISTLADLAALAVDEMELRLAATALREESIQERQQARLDLERSEEHFRSLIENASDLIAVVDGDGTMLYQSPSIERVLGYGAGELIGRNAFEFIHPEDAGVAQDALKHAFQHPGVAQTAEYRLRHQDGSWRVLESTGRTLAVDAADGAIINSRDITRRKRAEDALQQAHDELEERVEERTRDLADVIGTLHRENAAREVVEAELSRKHHELSDFFENAVMGLRWVGADGIILWANRAELDLLGYTREEYIGHSIADFHADAPAKGDVLRRLTSAETLNSYEARLRCKDGSIKEVLISSNVLFKDGKFVHTRCFTRDITQRKQAERSLQQREHELRALIENAPDIITRFDRQLRHRFVNPAVERLTGIPARVFLGKTHRELDMPPRLIEQWETRLRRVFETGQPSLTEFTFTRADGVILHFESRSTPEIGADGMVESVLTVARDITERKQAEEELNHFFAVSIDMLCIAGFDGCFKRLNPAWEATLGYSIEELTAVPFLDFVHAEDRAATIDETARLVAGQDTVGFENRYRCKDGSYKWLRWQVTAVLEEQLMYAVAHDITARKEAEEELARGAHLAKLTSDVALALTQGDSLQDTLQSCTQALALHLDAALARIWTLNAQGNVLELQASSGLSTRLDGEYSRVPVGHLKIGLIAQERQPHLTNQVLGDERVRDQEWARREGLVAFAGYPLIVEDRVVGVLAIFERRALTQASLHVLSIMAGTLAVGIQRKQAEAALRASEEQFRSLTEAIPQQVWTARPDGSLDYVNGRILEYAGRAREEMLGVGWAEMIHPDDLAETFARWKRSLETGEDYETEFRLRRADGVYRWNLGRAVPVRDGQGRIVKWFGTNTDIAEHRQAEEALRDSEARFRQLVAQAADAFFLIDRDARLIDVNQRACDSLGYSRQELLALGVGDIDAISRLEIFRSAWKSAQGGGAVTREGVHRRKDGTTFPIEVRASVFDFGGDQMMLALARDITERKRIEEALRESEARKAAIVETALDCIITMDHEGKVLEWNPAAEGTFGYSRAETMGQLLGELIVPESLRERHYQGIARYLASGEGPVLGKRIEVPALRADGTEIVVELSITPIWTDGPPIFTAYLRDITARKQTDEALKAAKQEAERANRAKSEFLSRMSHELRTPLNAILGFGQLLEMDDLNDEQRQGVGQILKGGRHLLELINEVLDIARIESEQQPLDIEPVPVVETLAGALEMVQPLAATRGIELSGDWEAAAGLFVLADRRRLKQVLLNLLANAVKYNRGGGTATLTGAATAAGHLRIAVSDTGLGIAPEKIGQLFTPFERLGAEQTAIEGTGLGLALSKRLVEAMGGEINVQSVVGQGSTFVVELLLTPEGTAPQSPASTPPSPAEHATHQTSRQPVEASETQAVVLYIEDNLSNFGLVQTILRHRPEIKLLAAMQGQAGLELAQRHRPDLILLDFHLPDINGDEVLRRLRQEPETRDIPVLIVSADATPLQIERMRAAGANDYLTKPLDVKRFLEVLNEQWRATQEKELSQ